MDYPALTPGTSPSGAPLINPIFLNFFSPRRAAASLSLSQMRMTVDDDGGGGGDEAFLFSIPSCTEESDAWWWRWGRVSCRPFSSEYVCGVRFHLSTSCCSNREARADRGRERERDREGGRWVGVSACESYTSPALFKSIPLFSPLLALDDEKPDRREMKMKQSKGSLCASLWFYTHADLSGCEVTEQWAPGPFLCRFLPKWMCLLRLVFH